MARLERLDREARGVDDAEASVDLSAAASSSSSESDSEDGADNAAAQLLRQMRSVSHLKVGLVSMEGDLLRRYRTLLSSYDRRALRVDVDRLRRVLRARGRTPLEDDLAWLDSPQAVEDAGESAAPDGKAHVFVNPDLERPEAAATLETPFQMRYDRREVLAYAATRMPRTYGALQRVFSEVARRCIDARPHSMLDFGAGLGMSSLVASQHFPSLQEFLAVERSPAMTSIGSFFLQDLPNLAWRRELLDRRAAARDGSFSYDIVAASYVLTEQGGASEREAIVANLWHHCDDLLFLVEPGTPSGYQVLMRARDQLIELAGAEPNGAHIVAPCTHMFECPMARAQHGPDSDGRLAWCHFVQKVHRSPMQRNAKRLQGSASSDENEKFCFLVVRRGQPLHLRAGGAESDDAAQAADGIQPARPGELERASFTWPRVIGQPHKRRRHVNLTLCTPDGELARVTPTKRKSSKHEYRAARKAFWGDLWPF